jgi:hypothetical protein
MARTGNPQSPRRPLDHEFRRNLTDKDILVITNERILVAEDDGDFEAMRLLFRGPEFADEFILRGEACLGV